jgi:glycosyltransferase involved in cell wall biosynthesis
MLAPEFIPAWGGVGTYIFELVRHLPKDIEVHVVTPMRESFGKEKISTSSDYDFSRFYGNNVHVHFVCKARDTFFYNAKFQYACLKYVPKLIKEERIDLIHSHTAHMPDLLLMFRSLNKPIVTTVHTTIKSQRLGVKLSNRNLHDLERSEKATLLLYPALRFVEEIYFRRKRLYITPSKWMKQWLENNFHINGYVRVIPNAVDISNYESTKCDGELSNIIPPNLRSRKIVLYAGRLLAAKGVDILIDSIPEVLKAVEPNEVLFIFAGPGSIDKYRSKAKRMQIEDYCLFTGPLHRQIVVRLMMSAEVVVLPSYLENSPFVILESMACGTPVISTDVGGIPEIIKSGYNGILVKPGSIKALAEAIIEILNDKKLRNLFSLHAKETVRNRFSWPVIVKKYLEAYSDAFRID